MSVRRLNTTHGMPMAGFWTSEGGRGMGEGRASADGARWMAVGRSADPDARVAGERATRLALTGPDAKLLIVFGSHTYDPVALAEGIAAAAPGVPEIGCSTPGEIPPDGPAGSAGLVTPDSSIG